MKRSFHLLINASLLLSLLLLAACSKKTPTPGPEAVYTSAAETVQAQLQTQGLPTAAATTTPFEFKTATEAAPPSNPEATLPPVVLPSLPAAATSTPSVPDRAIYISQSPSDDTSIPVNTPFTMTWTVQNTGTTKWTANYQLRFYIGEKFGSPATTNLNKEVNPGEQVSISLNLTTPKDPGNYNGTWTLSNAEGGNFRPLDVTIKVVPPPTGTPTLTETATSVPLPADTLTPEPTVPSGG